jgi:transcriptional regulator with XRE-family HTH domain
MNTTRVGNALREVRRYHRWTLARAASEARISAAVASRVENGRFDICSLEAINAYARGLGADVDLYVRWRGGDLNRLVNRRHSAMHEQMAALWKQWAEWEAVPEVSFSFYGERGVIDWFGWHARSETVLIEELKSQLVDVGDLVATNDRRMRLATDIARERGWRARTVASWVLLEDTRTNRRHLAKHDTFLRTAFPADGRTMRAWLREPAGSIRCLSFLPMVQQSKRERPSMGGLVAPGQGLIVPANAGHETMATSTWAEPDKGSPDENMTWPTGADARPPFA